MPNQLEGNTKCYNMLGFPDFVYTKRCELRSTLQLWDYLPALRWRSIC
jgi:hypothetical protein